MRCIVIIFLFICVKFELWDMKVTEEAEETLNEIRLEMESAAEGSVMYVNITASCLSYIYYIYSHCFVCIHVNFSSFYY